MQPLHMQHLLRACMLRVHRSFKLHSMVVAHPSRCCDCKVVGRLWAKFDV